MSTPENPLSDFRSYSVSHTLIMCDGMRTADELYYNPNIIPDTVDDPELLNDVQTITLPAIGNATQANLKEETEGKYIVLIDGKNSTNFFIKSVKWDTVFSPKGKTGESKFESIETEGEMVIEEPFGVEFLEALVKGTHEMGIDPSNVVFMLKTYFVGFDDNGNQQLLQDIQPFTFIMIDLTSEMSASGSIYNITLFGTSNGVGHLPQISAIANGLMVTLNRGDTIAQALTALETAIRVKYENFKKKLLPTLASDIRQRTGETQVISNAAASRIINDTYQDVVYKISLAKSSESGSKSDYAGYLIGTNEAHDTFNEETSFTLKFGESSTVDECIKEIMQTSAQVLKEATENIVTKRSYSPKIVSQLVSPDREGTYQVNYTVNRFETIYQPPGEPYKPQDGEAIIFDYIYTGKNVDVLEYDIKMDMGLSFFQTQISPSSHAATQDAQLSIDVVKDTPLAARGYPFRATGGTGTEKSEKLVKSPLFLGESIPPSSYSHKIDTAGPASFDQALQRQATLESIQARIVIAGNPVLLNELLERSDDFIAPDAASTAMVNKFKRPGYVKVNVKFPATKELDGVKSFWYNGFFWIFSIENVFEDGKFTQNIEMFSMPVSSALPRSTASQSLANTTTSTGSGSLRYVTQKHTVYRSQEVVDVAVKPSVDVTLGVLLANGDEFIDKPKSAGYVKDANVQLWYKSEVNPVPLTDEIKRIFDEIVKVWATKSSSQVDGYRSGIQPVITSANDGNHSDGSKHDFWLAIDLRANNLHPDENESVAIGLNIAQLLSIAIGNDYDVIYENYPDYSNNHIHVEYDPKPVKVISEKENEGNSEQ